MFDVEYIYAVDSHAAHTLTALLLAKGEKKVGVRGSTQGQRIDWPHASETHTHTRCGFSISHGFVGGWQGTFVAFQRHWIPTRTKLGH